MGSDGTDRDGTGGTEGEGEVGCMVKYHGCFPRKRARDLGGRKRSGDLGGSSEVVMGVNPEEESGGEFGSSSQTDTVMAGVIVGESFLLLCFLL